MNKSKQPGIKIDDILLLESSCRRDSNIPRGQKLTTKVNFEFSYTMNKEKTAGASIIGAVVRLFSPDDEIKSIAEFSAKFQGRFSVDDEAPNMELEPFLESNAPALLYSYLRQHIQSITVKSSLPAIHLPIMNVIALIQDIKKKQVEEGNSSDQTTTDS